jgi:hypothetical protein
MSRGPSGPSNFGNGGSSRQFSRTYQGSQGRTVYNQERGNRNLYNRYEGEDRNGFENREGNRMENGGRYASREGNRVENGNRLGKGNLGVGKGNLGYFRHGIAGGNFFEHGRHFGFRRFWNGEWVFLTAWDSCTAWVWANVGPGVWAWTPIDVCIG